jgi:hypothetical protein
VSKTRLLFEKLCFLRTFILKLTAKAEFQESRFILELLFPKREFDEIKKAKRYKIPPESAKKGVTNNQIKQKEAGFYDGRNVGSGIL